MPVYLENPPGFKSGQHFHAFFARLRELREVSVRDLDFVSLLLAHPEVMRYSPKCYNLDEAPDWIKRQRDRYANHGLGVLGKLIHDTQQVVAGFGWGLRLVKAEGPVDPAQRVVRRHLNQRRGNFEGGVPLLCLRANLPANFQDSRMRLVLGRDLAQFFLGLDRVAQFEPALRGLQMEAVWWFKRLHTNRDLGGWLCSPEEWLAPRPKARRQTIHLPGVL